MWETVTYYHGYPVEASFHKQLHSNPVELIWAQLKSYTTEKTSASNCWCWDVYTYGDRQCIDFAVGELHATLKKSAGRLCQESGY